MLLEREVNVDPNSEQKTQLTVAYAGIYITCNRSEHEPYSR